MTGSVRYSGGDNSILRFILYETWGPRCYWCHKPKEFNDIQIDHILSQDTGAKDYEELKTRYELPHNFDIDGPENLAPICNVCNGTRGKGKMNYGPRPVMLSQLEQARKLRPKVIERVLNFGNSNKVAEYLLKASQTDLKDPNARQAFEEHAPVIVQKLALLDETKADFISFKTVSLEFGEEHPFGIGVSLSGPSRTALAILEGVCGCTIKDALKSPIGELVDKTRQSARAEFEYIEGPVGPTTSGPPITLYLEVVVDSISYERRAQSLVFSFGGKFENEASASLVQQNPLEGHGLVDLQGDIQASGRFSFDVIWDFWRAPGDVDTGECLIDSWISNYVSTAKL
ncbi:HNH endonuclease [Nonomuraea zeae]|uniref:HNH endonuclease n=1 Tax=Nonomuraea zeae TaxID=1642303 RepID=A0A5S4H079_9ACTN|nr:hypothetical protein [Nonomuraea zeae]TMR38094.1 hypothetical protein ETD85_05525 [Nonomuraea zeae]